MPIQPAETKLTKQPTRPQRFVWPTPIPNEGSEDATAVMLMVGEARRPFNAGVRGPGNGENANQRD